MTAPKVGGDARCAYVYQPPSIIAGWTCCAQPADHVEGMHVYVPPAAPEPDTAELPVSQHQIMCENRKSEPATSAMQHDATGLAVAALYDRVAALEVLTAKHGQRLDGLEKPSGAAERVRDNLIATETFGPRFATEPAADSGSVNGDMEPAAARSPEAAKRRIYVAGPMKSKPDSNRPAFASAAERLRAKGHEVVTPPELCAQGLGWTFSDDHAMKDVETIFWATTIFMLRDWERSNGARAEHALAVWLGREIWYEAAYTPGYGKLLDRAAEEAQRAEKADADLAAARSLLATRVEASRLDAAEAEVAELRRKIEAVRAIPGEPRKEEGK